MTLTSDTGGPADRKFAAWLGSGCKRPAPASRQADAGQPEKSPKFPPGSPSSIVCLAFDDLRLGAFKLDDKEDEAWARPASVPPRPLADCAAETTCPNLGPEEFVAHFADEFVCRSSHSFVLAASERSLMSPAHDEGWETLTEDSDVGFDSAAAEFEPLPR